MTQDSKLKTHKNYFLFQALALLILVCFTKFPQAGLNDGDSITHYLISRYSWQYPQLFLDNWGKPFFILLSSGFAQLGYGGIQLFNITCGVIAGWATYRVADYLGIKYSYTAPVFLFLTPVFFNALPSGLTEILFALVLIGSLYLLCHYRYFAAAILISFLPFCRTEGILILPIIGLWLFMQKKYWPIPFLLSGFLIYSVAGYFFRYDDLHHLYPHDFFWLMHTNPYHGTDVYGHGPITHFIESYIPIFGNILGILFIFGLFYYGYTIYLKYKNKTPFTTAFLFEFLLVFGSVMVYFWAHSIFWWKGLFGSAGLWRVMAGIAPVYALVSMRGITWGSAAFKWNKPFYVLLWLVLIGIIIYQPIHYFSMPVGLDERKRTVLEACDWVKDQNLHKQKIFYSEPFTKICLSLDPYNNEKSEEMMYVWKGDRFGKDMPAGSIIMWESGLGPHEDGIPLEWLTNSPDFKLIKVFEAAHDMAGDKKYGVYIFEKQGL